MTTPLDPDALIDALAPLLDLPVDPAHRPGVVQNLRAAQAAAARMAGFAQGDLAEPAPVFRPESLE